MKFIWVVVVFLLLLVSCSKSNRNPVALFTMNPDNGRSPLKVSFDASNSSDLDGTIKDYQWNFGDGKTAEGANVEHEFTAEGEYDIELRVIDNDGAEGSISKKLIVKANSVPLAESQQLSTKQDEAIDITLVASDKEDDVLTYTITSNPENGSLTGNVPNITYQPNNDFVGIDSLAFKVNDGRDDSSVAIINITVTDGLEPNNDINQATNIVIGEVVRSFINPDGDIDWFSFEIEKEATVAITVRAKEITSDLDPFVALLDKDEEVIAKNDNRNADNTDSFLEASVAAGSYFISVWDSNKGDLFPQLAPLAASTTFYEITVEINPCKPDAVDCPTGDADGDGTSNADDTDNSNPCIPDDTVKACTDTIDKDGDGTPSTTDPDDSNPCVPNDSVKVCTDTIDEDNDGASKTTDPDDNDPCKPDNFVKVCTDTIDEDSDGTSKTTDPDDNNPCVPNSTTPACTDTIDNDGDGISATDDPNDNDPCVPDNSSQDCNPQPSLAIVPKQSSCNGVAVNAICTVTVELTGDTDTYRGIEFDITNPNFTLNSALLGNLVNDCLIQAGAKRVGIICDSGFTGAGVIANIEFTRTAATASTFITANAKLIAADLSETPVSGSTLEVN